MLFSRFLNQVKIRLNELLPHTGEVGLNPPILGGLLPPGSIPGPLFRQSVSVLRMPILYSLCPAKDVGHAHPTKGEEDGNQRNNIHLKVTPIRHGN